MSPTNQHQINVKFELLCTQGLQKGEFYKCYSKKEVVYVLFLNKKQNNCLFCLHRGLVPSFSLLLFWVFILSHSAEQRAFRPGLQAWDLDLTRHKRVSVRRTTSRAPQECVHEIIPWKCKIAEAFGFGNMPVIAGKMGHENTGLSLGVWWLSAHWCLQGLNGVSEPCKMGHSVVNIKLCQIFGKLQETFFTIPLLLIRFMGRHWKCREKNNGLNEWVHWGKIFS